MGVLLWMPGGRVAIEFCHRLLIAAVGVHHINVKMIFRVITVD
jgi:hypothetical protein